MDRIRENFTESIQTKIAAAEVLSENIQTAAQMLAICLLNGNKILACGNGASAALAKASGKAGMATTTTTKQARTSFKQCDFKRTEQGDGIGRKQNFGNLRFWRPHLATA